jgi:hypothetical protein
MNFRTSSALLACAASLLLLACPPPAKNDGGIDEDYDGSVPVSDGGCTGGCTGNKVCDAVKRVCVDPCGGCANGGVCQKNAMGAWQCVTPVITCNGALCGEGEIACVAGECGCLGPARASKDSCVAFGKVCVSTKCVNPGPFEACNPASIATSPCPQNHSCKTIFGDEGEEDAVALCTPNCDPMAATNTCERGMLCHELGCLPTGLFNGRGCAIQVMATLADGGMAFQERAVPASNVCLLRDGNGTFSESTPSGNCAYSFFRLPDTERYTISNCRQPGTATEGQRCKRDFRTAAVATQCGLGLDCFISKGDEGVCLRMCNAVPNLLGGPTPQPACGAGEVCTNVFRVDDDNNNAVEGMCLKGCDVFDAAKNTCAAVGSTAASCVPTGSDGHTLSSPDGKGICIPQQATIAAVGAECPPTDPYLGAVCGNSQLCLSTSSTAKPVCVEACDYECNASDAGVPSRCATEAHARCTGGKTCTRVSSPGSARMGVCR